MILNGAFEMDKPCPPYTPEPVSTDAERPPSLNEIKQHIIASEYHTDEALRLISLWEKLFDEAMLTESLDAASDEALSHFEANLEHNSSDGPSAGGGNA